MNLQERPLTCAKWVWARPYLSQIGTHHLVSLGCVPHYNSSAIRLCELATECHIGYNFVRETLEHRTLSLHTSRLTAFDAELMLPFGGRGHRLGSVGYRKASLCGDGL